MRELVGWLMRSLRKRRCNKTKCILFVRERSVGPDHTIAAKETTSTVEWVDRLREWRRRKRYCYSGHQPSCAFIAVLLIGSAIFGVLPSNRVLKTKEAFLKWFSKHWSHHHHHHHHHHHYYYYYYYYYVNLLHPNINMHILHTVRHTFYLRLGEFILTIKSFSCWWLFYLFSRP